MDDNFERMKDRLDDGGSHNVEVTEINSPNSDEDEEVLLYLSFPDFLQTKLFDEPKEIKLERLGTSNPSCEIDGIRFTGTNEFSLGTQLFFDIEQKGDEFLVGYSNKRIRFDLQFIPDYQKNEFESCNSQDRVANPVSFEVPEEVGEPTTKINLTV